MMAGQGDVMSNMRRAHDQRVRASRALLRSYAAEIGNWMRANARWTDRTGNARNSLEGITDFSEDALRLFLKGGGPPDYMVFLELAHAGRYAIVRPALEQFSGRIYQDLVRIWQG